MTDMTRVEAIEMLKSMKYEDDENCLENQALDIAIASLTIDEKYDLEFARSEEQKQECEYEPSNEFFNFDSPIIKDFMKKAEE